MNLATHEALNRDLCGTPVAVGEGRATVRMTASSEMVADRHQLVHGGFVFGLADHAAMLAINHPNVVLGGAEVRFLAPVSVGDELIAEARVTAVEGVKQIVESNVARRIKKRQTAPDRDRPEPQPSGENSELETVMTGRFTCFSPERHVLASTEGNDS